jgi:hypothetical protein
VERKAGGKSMIIGQGVERFGKKPVGDIVKY